jgi:hypothetical protein
MLRSRTSSPGTLRSACARHASRRLSSVADADANRIATVRPMALVAIDAAVSVTPIALVTPVTIGPLAAAERPGRRTYQAIRRDNR